MKSGGAHAIVRLEWPAHELEEQVIEKLLASLKSNAEVFDALSAAEEGSAIIGNMGLCQEPCVVGCRFPLTTFGTYSLPFSNGVIIQEKVFRS
jgi:hypothetical protein